MGGVTRGTKYAGPLCGRAGLGISETASPLWNRCGRPLVGGRAGKTCRRRVFLADAGEKKGTCRPGKARWERRGRPADSAGRACCLPVAALLTKRNIMRTRYMRAIADTIRLRRHRMYLCCPAGGVRWNRRKLRWNRKQTIFLKRKRLEN